MAAFTNYLEDKLLDHARGKTSYTMPSIWIGLSTTTPAEDGTNFTEPSGGSYARKSTAGADWAASSGGASTTAQALAFATASASWGTITHFGLFDASSGGNLIMFGALGTAKAVGNGDTLSFASGEIDVTLD